MIWTFNKRYFLKPGLLVSKCQKMWQPRRRVAGLALFALWEQLTALLRKWLSVGWGKGGGGRSKQALSLIFFPKVFLTRA